MINISVTAKNVEISAGGVKNVNVSLDIDTSNLDELLDCIDTRYIADYLSSNGFKVEEE